MLRHNKWYHVAIVDNRYYLNGKRLTWWRRLLLWCGITILIIAGKEKM